MRSMTALLGDTANNLRNCRFVTIYFDPVACFVQSSTKYPRRRRTREEQNIDRVCRQQW